MCPVVAAVLSVVDICYVISILADVGAAIEFILVGVAAGSELAGLFLCAENDNLNDKHPFVHLQMLIINSTLLLYGLHPGLLCCHQCACSSSVNVVLKESEVHIWIMYTFCDMHAHFLLQA